MLNRPEKMMRGEKFSHWLVVCVYVHTIGIRVWLHYSFFSTRMPSIFNGILLVCVTQSLSALEREEAVQRPQHILRKYLYASSEGKNPFCVVHRLIKRNSLKCDIQGYMFLEKPWEILTYSKGAEMQV